MWMTLIGIVVLPLMAVLLGLLLMGIDRKVAARMQRRVGPPILQPFYDVRKLFLKDTIIPRNSTWVFDFMPLLSVVPLFVIILYLPFLGISPILHGDMVFILYLLILPSLAKVLGGISSGSPYTAIGSQREITNMMGCEFPLITIVFFISWKLFVSGITKPFSVVSFTGGSAWAGLGMLGFGGSLLLLFVMLLVITGELSRPPFDLSSAGEEIAGGIMAEYSGRNLGLFYIADALKLVVLTTLVVVLFFPFGISDLLGVAGWLALISDAAFYFIKVVLLMVFSETVLKTSISRLKITQLVGAYWVNLLLLSILGAFIILIDMVMV